MTTHSRHWALAGPSRANVHIHLGSLPAAIRRVGDWTVDGSEPADGYPFVSVDVGDHVTVMSTVPDHLDQLAYCLADAAESLREVQHSQAAHDQEDAHELDPLPDLFSDQATA